MASPNFDKNSVDLSVMLNDYSSTAAGDGKIYSSLSRSYLLNEAMSTLFGLLYEELKQFIWTDNVKLNRFNDFIVDTSGVTASSTLTTSSTIVEVINILNTTTKRPLKIMEKRNNSLIGGDDQKFIPSNTLPFAFVASTTTIKVLPSVSDGTKFTYSYLSQPRFDFVAGDTTSDMLWNQTFWNDIKKLAVAQAMLDDGNVQGYQAYMQAVLQKYGQEQQEAKQ
jgi:hypothetical protein